MPRALGSALSRRKIRTFQMAAENGALDPRIPHRRFDIFRRLRHLCDGRRRDGRADSGGAVFQMKGTALDHILHRSLKGMAAATVGMEIDKPCADIAVGEIIFLLHGELITRQLQNLSPLKIKVSAKDSIRQNKLIGFDSFHL